MVRRYISVLVGVLGLLFGAAFCCGQVPQAQILGTVADQVGGVLSGSDVVLQNQKTQVSQSTKTTSSGDFAFPYLDSGTYRLTVKVPGFQTFVATDITVQIQEKRRVNVSMVVGRTETTVEVSGEAPRIDTDSATIGTVISNREVAELPVSGREFSKLAAIVPGVRQTGSWGGGNFITTTSTQITVGGTPAAKTGYDYDGVDNTLNRVKGPAMNPSMDSIGEMRVDRSQFAAEAGRYGALVDVETKSGTNRFHGALWEYVRNYRFNAGNYTTHKQDSLKRNQYGANFGGPIIKNKLFLFFNWEGQRQSSSTQILGSVFTTPMRTGDLGQFTTPINDPQTGQPFPNNIIPANRLNPIAVALMNAYMPLPNVNSNLQSNYIRALPTTQNNNQYIGRADYQASEKDRFFLRGSGNWRNGIDPPLDATSVTLQDDFKFFNGGVGWDRTWTPTIISDLRFGYHGEGLLQTDVPLANYADPSNNILAIGETQAPANRVPITIISPFYDFAEWGFPVKLAQNSYELLGNITISHGKHTLKTGFLGRTQTTAHPVDGGSPEVMVNNGAYSGNGVADFLLGLPFVAQNKLHWIPRLEKYGDYSAYLQDDWKATSSLTLNLGLRYELHGQPSEAHDLFSSFYPQLGKIAVAGNSINTQYTQPLTLNAWAPLLVSASATNLPIHTLAFGHHRDFSPRIGFAWRPFRNSNKTVVRGGYGLFYLVEDGQWMGDISDFSVPYGGIVRVTNAAAAPGFTLRSPWLTPGIAVPPPTALYRDPHAPESYSHDLTLGFEQELVWGVVAEVNAQDQNSKHLESCCQNLNQPTLSVGPVAPRPYLNMGSLISWYTHLGHGRYDSLEVVLRKRSAHYTFQWSHVYAKNVGLTGALIVDPYHPEMWRGPNGYSPNQDKVDFVVDLPWGQGRDHPFHNGIENQILGGWTVAAISTLYQSGNPYTISWSGDPSNTGTFVARADQTCSGHLSNPTMAKWFNTSCFGAPANGTWGNAGTGILIGPHTFSGDFSVSKNFPIRESMTLQFRAEMFNVFNHPNLAMPNTTANNPNFGKISTKIQSPRELQFALRLNF